MSASKDRKIVKMHADITKLRAERDNWATLCAAAGEELRAAKADLAAAQAEQDKWYQAYQSMLDPIVRAKMLEPAPPMIAPVGMAEQVLLRERDQLHADLAAARALLKRQPPSDCRPCHECGAIWWSDEHGCWFVGGQRERTALAGKDAL